MSQRAGCSEASPRFRQAEAPVQPDFADQRVRVREEVGSCGGEVGRAGPGGGERGDEGLVRGGAEDGLVVGGYLFGGEGGGVGGVEGGVVEVVREPRVPAEGGEDGGLETGRVEEVC